MIQEHTFQLKNETHDIDGAKCELDFRDDEGKIFRYRDFSAMQAEKFAISLSALMPSNFREKFHNIAENSSNYDATNIMMSDEEFILTAPECVDFLNKELQRFELFDKEKDRYEPLTIDRLDNEIQTVATIGYLRAKLLKAFSDFFTKGNSSNCQNPSKQQNIKQGLFARFSHK